MALCDSSVLTGQEGSIVFKPPGTSVTPPCVDFSCLRGTDLGNAPPATSLGLLASATILTYGQSVTS